MTTALLCIIILALLAKQAVAYVRADPVLSQTCSEAFERMMKKLFP